MWAEKVLCQPHLKTGAPVRHCRGMGRQTKPFSFKGEAQRVRFPGKLITCSKVRGFGQSEDTFHLKKIYTGFYVRS